MENKYTGREYMNYARAFLIPNPGEVPVTELGEWINSFLTRRELTIGEAIPIFNLCSLDAFRKKPIVQVSAGSFQNLLLGAVEVGSDKEEIDQLVDIITLSFEGKAEIAKQKKIRLERIQSEEGGVAFTTDAKLARQLLGDDVCPQKLEKLKTKMFKIRQKVGIISPFTQEEAEKIMNYLNKLDDENNAKS